MTLVIASLYFVAIFSLFGSAIYVVGRAPRERLNQYFGLLAASLLVWVATLLAYQSEPAGAGLLWVGRINFAAIIVASTASYLFVCELVGRPAKRLSAIWLETVLFTAATTFTPLVDDRELVSANGSHSTEYGQLFWLYLAHVILYVAVAVVLALHPPTLMRPRGRLQARLIGYGLLAMTVIALFTNVYLPYVLGDFRYVDVGTLSTLAFVAGAGYAVFALHMFNVHVIVRATMIYAGVIAVALELYNLALEFLAKLIPLGAERSRDVAATAIVLVISGFTQEPIKKYLERLGHKKA